MFLNIMIIIFGIIVALIGLVATVAAFEYEDPIDHIWSIPLMLAGIFIIYTTWNSIIETKVNERLQQYQTENVVEKVVDN